MVEAARGDISLTYFEVATLAALWIFRAHKVDVQVLEVGLWSARCGQHYRCGSHNHNEHRLDHMDWLGDDRDSSQWKRGGYDPAVPAS